MFRALSITAAVLTLALMFPAPVKAADADVCYSPPTESLNSVNVLKSSTPLRCPRAGTHTLPELAAAGWKIVAVMSVAVTLMPHPTDAWMVVIEKPDSRRSSAAKAPLPPGEGLGVRVRRRTYRHHDFSNAMLRPVPIRPTATFSRREKEKPAELQRESGRQLLHTNT